MSFTIEFSYFYLYFNFSYIQIKYFCRDIKRILFYCFYCFFVSILVQSNVGLQSSRLPHQEIHSCARLSLYGRVGGPAAEASGYRRSQVQRGHAVWRGRGRGGGRSGTRGHGAVLLWPMQVYQGLAGPALPGNITYSATVK